MTEQQRNRVTAAKSLQLCPTLCDPIDAAHQAPPSLGFSRQEHWSGSPCPSPMHESEKWKWSREVVSDPQRPQVLQPSRLLHPWDFPGKSTGVGCHCLLQNRVTDIHKFMVTKWKGGKLCAVLICLVMSDLKGGGEGLIKRLELIYTLCYMDLLNRNGNCTQYYVITSTGKKSSKKNI